MRYIEIPPSTTLVPYIRCFWVLESADPPPPPRDSGERVVEARAGSTIPEELSSHEATGACRGVVERVYPDGCAELVFHRGERFELAAGDGSFHRQPRALAVGQLERHILLRRPRRVCTIGVRLQHAGLAPLLGVPAYTLTGGAFALEDVVGRWGVELEQSALSASTLSTALRRTEEALARRVRDLDDRDAALDGAIGQLVARRGRVRVNDLAVDAGISVRQLERRFRARVGLSPKRLATILRLQGAFGCLTRGAPVPLIDVAHVCGYFDQSHFVRDFQRFTGQTPGRFVREDAGIGRLFFSSSPGALTGY